MFTYTGDIPYCKVRNTIESKLDNRIVYSINENQHDNYTNILGFWAEYQIVRYFPHNLTRFFPNLNSVGFRYSGMMEVHAEDLQEFGEKLQYFRIANSKIETIEKDLFKYNPNLGIIGLDHNRIKYIEGYVFDHLTHLKNIWLDRNDCIDENVSTRADVEKLSDKIKNECHRNYMILKTYELVGEISKKFSY
jgi:Leucine rich repeat